MMGSVSPVDLSGRVCIVTGANGKLGKAVSLELAKLGATVVLACRDQARGEAARSEIEAATGNNAAELMVVDLAVQRSVREMAASFKKKHNRLDVLVNNAAVLKDRRVVTPDGLETMFATNHLGPFLLTNLLLDELKAAGGASVIVVTAPSTTKLDFEDLQGGRKFNALAAFGASKMCNLLFTYELARRLAGSGVTANALHPGLIKSNLLNEAPPIVRWLSHLFSATPGRAAESLVYVASSPEVEGVTGKFFKGKKLINSNKYSSNPSIQTQLWDVSAELVGLG